MNDSNEMSMKKKKLILRKKKTFITTLEICNDYPLESLFAFTMGRSNIS